MDLFNSSVQHKVFGAGKISDLTDNIVSVRFGLDVKKFIYPDVFRQYLMMTDEEGKQYVDGILNEIDKESKLSREAEALREETRRKLEKFPVHANAQAAFKFVDNEKQSVLENWSVRSGNYLSGRHRGNPRPPSRIYPNSACLLTSCGENDSEDNRLIWGVFMANDDFIGSDCSDGFIPAHEKYRIILEPSESKTLLFWPLVNDGADSQLANWGSTELKYFSNLTMARILSSILRLKRGTDQEQLCGEFMSYFCKLNKIGKEQIPV